MQWSGCQCVCLRCWHVANPCWVGTHKCRRLRYLRYQLYTHDEYLSNQSRTHSHRPVAVNPNPDTKPVLTSASGKLGCLKLNQGASISWRDHEYGVHA